MNREEKIESLKLYLEGCEKMPAEAQRQGISLYEFKTIVELLLEISVAADLRQD